MRRLQESVETTGVGGINQQAEKATLLELADARNVWAPDGRVIARPGYVGIGRFPDDTQSLGTTFSAVTEDTSAATFTNATGGGILTLNDLVGRIADGGDQDRWYLGLSSGTFQGATIPINNTNSNATRFKAEYWNGTAWTYLSVVELANADNFAVGNHLSHASAFTIRFAVPQDWATTSVNSTTAYWIRFNLLYANLDASVEIDVINAIGGTTVSGNSRGLFALQFPTNKMYAAVISYPTGNSLSFITSASIDLSSGYAADGPGSINIVTDPPSVAVVPQFAEAFVSYNYTAYRYTADLTSPVAATVESRDFAVGSGAPYDPALIVQLSAFPEAKYISFFGGRLWCANLKDNPFAVRWGAASPYYKVFPAGSIEVLAEHDNSPITGMQPLGEYQVIYKSDSIWMAYPVGPDPLTGVESFAIKQVVAGVGCVSNSSIKSIRGNHIFLAEDGIYRFDGANVQKLSDPLNDTINSITPGRRPFAAAAHWKKKNLYLLSVTTDGSNTHNLTLAFDYKNGTWWLWDNIDAQHWLEDEASNDNEILYFGDSSGRIYQMDVGLTDHGGTIDSYITTHRFNFGGDAAMRVRGIDAWCTNDTREVDISVFVNDEETASGTGTLAFTSTDENDWDDFNYNAGATTDDNWVALRRRVMRLDLREDCDWFQIKVAHDQKNQQFQLSKIAVRVVPLGAR